MLDYLSQGKEMTMFSKRSFSFVAVFVLLAVMLSLATPALAGGAMQISGIGDWPAEGECTAVAADYAIKLTEGDLVGCVYVTIETAESSPSGTYRETGTEFYDIVGGTFGTGTFSTNYRFTGKFDDSGVEIFGRCQHPIAAGTGTGDFKGVTGRIDFKDDIATGRFPYRGHLRW
jgi:hypothetical protein